MLRCVSMLTFLGSPLKNNTHNWGESGGLGTFGSNSSRRDETSNCLELVLQRRNLELCSRAVTRKSYSIEDFSERGETPLRFGHYGK